MGNVQEESKRKIEFIRNQPIIMKKAQLALELYNENPNLTINADMILANYMKKQDYQRGIGKKAIAMYINGTDKYTYARLFRMLTGTSFETYLEDCVVKVAVAK